MLETTTDQKLWVTYKLANGDLVGGEYGFVTDDEFFDDIDEPVEVVKQTWRLVSSETVTFKPPWYEDEEPAAGGDNDGRNASE